MADLAQAVPEDRLDVTGAGDEAGGLDRARERAGVECRDPLVAEPIAEAHRLVAALVGQVDTNGAGESVLGAQLRGAMADQIETRGSHGRILCRNRPRASRTPRRSGPRASRRQASCSTPSDRPITELLADPNSVIRGIGANR